MMLCQQAVLLVLLLLSRSRLSKNCQYSCGPSSACSSSNRRKHILSVAAWAVSNKALCITGTLPQQTHQELCCFQKEGCALPPRTQADGCPSCITAAWG